MQRARTAFLLPVLLLAFPAGAGELADQLASTEKPLRAAAAKTLSDQGAAALSELTAALSKPVPTDNDLARLVIIGKLEAVHLLSRIEGPQAAEVLVGVLSHDAGIALAAAGALASQGDVRGEARLRDGLASAQPLERAEAAGALASIVSASAVPDLIRALEDEDRRVRAAASQALCDITLQDFDYDPEDPAQALPGSAEREEQKAILQWKADQYDLFKEGKLTYTDAQGKEHKLDPKRNKVEGENRIKKATVAKWNELRARYEALRLKARADAVAQWGAWWEAHRSETPGDWLNAGLGHPKPVVRRRAADRIKEGELRGSIPALVEALGRESDAGTAEVEARALASFRDKGVIEPLIAFLERMKDRKDVVAAIDLVLVDLTRVHGVSPSGRGWRAWWKRVDAFFEPDSVQMCGGLEYAVQLKEASEDGCTLEVRRWMPEKSSGKSPEEGEGEKGSWLAKTFRVKKGEAVGEKDVETTDRFQMKIQIDLTPGLLLEGMERDVRVVRRRPLKRQGVLRAVLKQTQTAEGGKDRPPLTLEIPAP